MRDSYKQNKITLGCMTHIQSSSRSVGLCQWVSRSSGPIPLTLFQPGYVHYMCVCVFVCVSVCVPYITSCLR